MRSNLENNLARQLHLHSPTHSVVSTVLDGSFVVPDDGAMFLFLDGGLSDRTVFLPEIPNRGGLMFAVANVGTSNALNVVDDDGNAVVTIEAEQFALMASSQTEWVALIGMLPAQNDFIAALLDEPTVVNADYVVLAADTTIAISRVSPAATAITLPTVASRNGAPVSIVDWSTALTEHTITLTPDGAETIMQQATWTLLSNAANLASVTLWPSVTLNGWYMKP